MSKNQGPNFAAGQQLHTIHQQPSETHAHAERPEEMAAGGGGFGKSNRNFPSHNCAVNHDVDLVKLLIPANTVPRRIARWWRRVCLIDHHSPIARLVFRSDTAIKREMSRQLTYYPGTIHPLSSFRFMWNCLMIVTFASAFLLIPYDITFLYRIEDYYPFTAFHAILLATDFICLLDVVINLYTGTYTRRSQRVDLNLSHVRRRYLRLWFWIDLITSAPDPLLTRLIPTKTLDNSLVYCLHRLNFHPGCLWDLWSLLSVMKILRFRTFLRYIRSLCQWFGLRRNVIKFIAILATVLTVFHWGTCLMFLVLRLAQGTDPARVDVRSWTMKIAFWNQTSLVRYMECSYRTMYTVAHITHDFNESMTYDDMLMSLIYTISGYILKIYLLAELLIFIRILFSSASKYHEYRYELSNYMRHEQLPAALQQQILSFYDFRHPRIYSRWTLIRSVLGEQLYGEMRMQMLGPLLRACPLFRAVFTDQQLTALALGMHYQLFMQNDIISRWETASDEQNWNMVFIVCGTVAVYTSGWRKVLHLEDGEHFGEFQLLFDSNMVVTRAWLDEFLQPYPALRRNLIDLATEHLHQMEQMQRGTVLEVLENVETVRMQPDSNSSKNRANAAPHSE
uniref:Cyclic nucleotide-binding domain-containing protein n=1 Tax=Anopheles epiroticus TaxID=199890 RepID=A0A182PN95_9DIPT